MSLKRLIKGVFLLFFIVNTGLAQNIAYNKSYSLSVQPNYPKSAKNGGQKILTDGHAQKTVTPTFWTSGRSLGWMNQNKIEIEVDLNKKEKLIEVSLNTANGENVGVYYAQNIYVFCSDNKSDYKYLGELITENNNAISSERSITNLKLSKLNIESRYIKFIILPRGNYFFVDEISIISGAYNKEKIYQSIKKNNLSNFVDEITNKQKENNNNRQLLSNKQQNVFKEGVIVEYVYNTNKFRSSDLPEGDYLASTAITNWGVVKKPTVNLLRLTNNTKERRDITIQQTKSKAQGSFEAYKTETVINSKSLNVYDALIQITNEPLTIKIEPNETCYIMLKTIYNTVGDFEQEIIFSNSSRNNEHVFKLSVSNYINSSVGLNIHNWSYFNYPQIKNVKEKAIKDLVQHGVNTFSIPRDVIAKINNDIDGFRSYFKGLPKKSNILLFFNFNKSDAKRIGKNNEVYLSDKWKKNFKVYLQNVFRELASLGYENIYIYPYDEVSQGDFEDFKMLTTWLRKDLKYKCFTTVLAPSMLKSGNYVDVVQVNRKVLKDKFISKINSEIWIYDITSYSRDVSPSSYRKMGWEAYLYNAGGIGFWNYSQSNTEQNYYFSKYTNGRNDYSVIYNDKKGNIVSSLRWEAFYQGAIDYSLLRDLERLNGKKWTIDFVRKSLLKDEEGFKRSVLELKNSVK